jgi:hypothetical protein
MQRYPTIGELILLPYKKPICDVTFCPFIPSFINNYTWNTYVIGERKMQSVSLSIKLCFLLKTNNLPPMHNL